MEVVTSSSGAGNSQSLTDKFSPRQSYSFHF